MNFDKKLLDLADEAEAALSARFAAADRISRENTSRIMKSFRENRVDATMFAGTNGYGYDDKGRDALDRIWAEVFAAESALVRHSIASGTHALTAALFGLLRPGDILLSVTGKPYDTLDGVIGIGGTGQGSGTLADFGVEYRQIELGEDITAALKACGGRAKVVFVQRSRGYLDRRTLTAAEIGEITRQVHENSDAYVVVDNCYGEFTESAEPSADLVVGSLIKNPGGGIAESGGYFAGSAEAVRLVSWRLTAPGIGAECGASLGQNRSLYMGLFFSPHAVAQALKTAMLTAYVFDALGFDVSPSWDDERGDIIQTVKLGSGELLCAFCRGIQRGSPVDAYVTPEPWAMPGYTDEVIMAAGAFTQGSSLELSADGPLRPPFTAFLQGGLTYESGRIGVLSAAAEVLSVRGG